MTPIPSTNNITILGAGLVGSLLSIYLKQKGYVVTVYEKRSDPRISSLESGRSINLALSLRGIKALQNIGLEKRALSEAIPMKGRMIHNEDESQIFQPYSETGDVIYSISRKSLNTILVNEAEASGVNVRFNHKCNGIDFDLNQANFSTPSSDIKENYDFLFGTDGAYSLLRKERQSEDLFNYSQQYLDYGYKELHLHSKNGLPLFDQNSLHIWPRHDFMLIALPNMDGSFNATLFLRFKGPNSFEDLKSESDLSQFFNSFFPDVVPYIDNLEKTFFALPPSSMITVQCDPWVFQNTCLLGDAAHAIVPFYGQGMNAGFEGVSQLMKSIDDNGLNKETLEKFSKVRKPNTDAIGKLAIRNFLEMRDLVTDPSFQLRKKIEAWLATQFPQYRSLYGLVTFSQVPYKKALDLATIQDEMFLDILQLPAIESDWNSKLAASILQIVKEKMMFK